METLGDAFDMVQEACRITMLMNCDDPWPGAVDIKMRGCLGGTRGKLEPPGGWQRDPGEK